MIIIIIIIVIIILILYNIIYLWMVNRNSPSEQLFHEMKT